MTQEDKELLLKDLSGRLPYGVKIRSFMADVKLNYDNYLEYIKLNCFRPYLRPMSSMTKEEKKYISDKCGFNISGPIGNECVLIMPVLAADLLIDFYNERHIDYRGLIPMGLALVAPEGMYI